MDIQQSTQTSVHKKIQNYMFNLNDKIGEGSFSIVYKGNNINNNSTVAIKKIRISDMKSKIAKRLLDCQISILKLISHPNIVKCEDVFCSVNNCYIVTELCTGGNLDQRLKNSKKIHEQELKRIIYFIFKALQHLNSLNIIHRDIKVSNILISDGGIYKIADFGFAIRANAPFKDIAIGSPVYMSPEGLIHNIYGPKTDIWAFGLLIYELIHGTTPLQSCKTEEELKAKVLLAPKLSSKIPSDLKILIQNCLKINQSQRISIAQLGRMDYMQKLHAQFSKQIVSVKQDLCLTKASTSSSVSQNNFYHFPQINLQAAKSLMSYCNLISKLIKYSDHPSLKKCLSWTATYIISARYPVQPAQSKRILDSIRQNCNQFLTQYGKFRMDNIDFKQLMQECSRNMISNKNMGVYFEVLRRQSQLLLKALQLRSMELYARQSHASEHARNLHTQ